LEKRRINWQRKKSSLFFLGMALKDNYLKFTRHSRFVPLNLDLESLYFFSFHVNSTQVGIIKSKVPTFKSLVVSNLLNCLNWIIVCYGYWIRVIDSEKSNKESFFESTFELQRDVWSSFLHSAFQKNLRNQSVAEFEIWHDSCESFESGLNCLTNEIFSFWEKDLSNLKRGFVEKPAR